MTSFGLVGYGKWGKILSKSISLVGNLVFISNTKKTYKNNKKIDWCLIATNDVSHYKIVKYFLKKKIPILCEKPLTRNLKLSQEIIKLSKKYKTKLYINHVELFKKKKLKIFKSNLIVRRKTSDDKIKNVLWKLCYHDLYLLYNHLKNKKLNINLIFLKEKQVKFSIFDGSNEFIFFYDYQSKKKIHKINNTNFITKINYLKYMIKAVINNRVNFDLNHKQALFCIRTILLIEKQIFKI